MDKLFDVPIIEDENKNKCRHCTRKFFKDYGRKKFYYCGLLKSNRTENGSLKIKLKDKACLSFRK